MWRCAWLRCHLSKMRPFPRLPSLQPSSQVSRPPSPPYKGRGVGGRLLCKGAIFSPLFFVLLCSDVRTTGSPTVCPKMCRERPQVPGNQRGRSQGTREGGVGIREKRARWVGLSGRPMRPQVGQGPPQALTPPSTTYRSVNSVGDLRPPPQGLAKLQEGRRGVLLTAMVRCGSESSMQEALTEAC